MNNKHIHVMQISNAIVSGGTRKHIHDILLNIDNSCFKQTYVYSNKAFDLVFENDIEYIKQGIYNTFPLKIERNPSFNDITNIIKLIRYVKKESVDIVHGHGAKGGLYARILAITCNTKAIYTPHGGIMHSMFNPLIEKIYIFTEKFLSKYTSYLLFESQYSADQFKLKIGGFHCRAKVNNNGIITPNIESIKKKSIEYNHICNYNGILKVGIFGTLRKEKGQIYAIKAIHELKNIKKIVHLHIFGDGSELEKNKLNRLAIELKIKNQIIFHGEVKQVEPYMYIMDIILIPSLFESFPYVALEAISLNKWVIASQVGGLPEIIQSGLNGMLVPKKNAIEIANAILLIEKDKLKNNLSPTPLQLKKFSLSKMISTITKIYYDTNNK